MKELLLLPYLILTAELDSFDAASSVAEIIAEHPELLEHHEGTILSSTQASTRARKAHLLRIAV